MIAILAILVIIALPNVINMYNSARKETFLTEAKKIYTESEKKFISSSISGSPTKVINSEDNTKLDMTGKKLKYCIILNNSGKVKSMKVSNGQWIASLENGKKIEDLTADDLVEGNLDDYTCGNQVVKPKPLNCTFDGELVQGAEYVNGQYTYRYMQEGGNINSNYTLKWDDITTDGWGVQLTDKKSSDTVNGKVCTTINNKPVVSMSYMFSYSNAEIIDLSNFDTSNVTNMSYMFEGVGAATIDVSKIDTSNVTNMSAMFFNNFATTINLSGLNTSKVTDMSHMFSFSKVTSLDLSDFDTSNVTDMMHMFLGSEIVTLNVSNFNTTNVIDMGGMFSKSSATTIKGLNKFNTSNVTNMGAMFFESNVARLDLSSFDTSNVTNMIQMFSETQLTSLDLSKFDTSNVESMSGMFLGSNNLKTIYVSNAFVTNKVTNSFNMFKSCNNLVGGAGTVYDANNVDITYARVDGGTSSPGYFTLKN